MPGKYDEIDAITDKIYIDLDLPDQDSWDRVNAILRSAFPPPAEDARGLAEGIMLSLRGNATDWPEATAYIAAEISSFAEARVEPWREGVRAALEYSGNRWSEWSERAEHVGEMLDALLSDSPAKEAAR